MGRNALEIIENLNRFLRHSILNIQLCIYKYGKDKMRKKYDRRRGKKFKIELSNKILNYIEKIKSNHQSTKEFLEIIIKNEIESRFDDLSIFKI